MTYLELGKIVFGKKEEELIDNYCPSDCFKKFKRLNESDLEDRGCGMDGDGLSCGECWNREIYSWKGSVK